MSFRYHAPYELALATAGSVGFDLRANIAEKEIVPHGLRILIGTGVRVAIDPGFAGFVLGRSGLTIKHGVIATTGTIDADYRGEISVMLFNLGGGPYEVRPGDRIAQLVVSPVIAGRDFAAAVSRVDAPEMLGATARGAGGFGSTGR